MKLWYNGVRMKPKGVILMSEEKKQLIATINEMPEEWTIKILAYIKKLKDEDDKDMPERLVIKDKEDLERKLDDGIKDIESGKVYSFDEVYNESKAILKG